MAVTMAEVRAILDPEEPDYGRIGLLGSDALEHLEVLIESGDQMLASKATYAASLVADARSVELVQRAAASDNPALRVAAAAATVNLAPEQASQLVIALAGDSDEGVKKAARVSGMQIHDPLVARALEAVLGLEQEPLAPEPNEGGMMPGEGGLRASEAGSGLMPGEGADRSSEVRAGRMPGEATPSQT